MATKKPEGLSSRLSELWDKFNELYPKLNPNWKAAGRIRLFFKDPYNPKFTNNYIESKIFNSIRISFRNQSPKMREISSIHGKSWYPELHKRIHNNPDWHKNQSKVMTNLNKSEEARLRSSKIGKKYGPKHLTEYNKSENGRSKSKEVAYRNIINRRFGSKGEERLYNHLSKLLTTYNQYQIEPNSHPYDMAVEFQSTIILIEFNGMLHVYDNNRKRDMQFIKFANDRGYTVVEFWQNELRNKHGEELDKYILNKIQRLYESKIA